MGRGPKDIRAHRVMFGHVGFCCIQSRNKTTKHFLRWTVFAGITLHPGGIIAWLVVGFIAGGLARLVMRGTGYGLSPDLIVGVAGAIIGGFLFSLVVGGEAWFWGSIVVAFLGACILIGVVRYAFGGHVRD